MARAIEAPDGWLAEDLFGDGQHLPLRPDPNAPPTHGDLVPVYRVGEEARVAGPKVARGGSAAASVIALAAEFDLDPAFPDAVHQEADALLAHPGIDDPDLVDMRDDPFVTIDNPGSRDLDQAMCITPDGDGHRVAYALADAAHFVRPGTALFEEALRRGASYYLPGFSIPMLPRALSEGVVSLNPMEDRRALVLVMRLDAEGALRSTRFLRARIRSQAKLSYPQVQSYYDAPDGHPLAATPFTETLDGLRAVGERRMRLAFERDVVRYRRRELSVDAGQDGPRFTLLATDRNDCERWNEQISLLCNTEGARLFAEAGRAPQLQPVFRVHDPPHHRRVAELARTIEALCARAGLDPKTWHWQRESGESLAEYLDRLPTEGPRAGLARAIQRQALVINNRSEFDDELRPHHGVGAAAYARFSSPMREIVGIFTHKEAIELIEAEGPERKPDTQGGDLELRDRVIAAGNRAKQVQNALTKAANKLAIDAVLSPDLALPIEGRPRRAAVLLGLTPTRAYVALEDPPVELKIYFDALGDGATPEPSPRPSAKSAKSAPEASTVACRPDASLLALRVGEREYLLGDPIELVVIGARDGRYALAPTGAAPTAPKTHSNGA